MTTSPLSREEELSKDLAAFDELLAVVTQACTPILEIRVTDPASEQQALSAAGQISTLLKRVETRRKELLAPLREQVERINAAAKKVEAALEAPRAHVDGQRRAYAQELERKKAEALRIQREKEDAERRAAAEKRAKEEAELRAKQEAERLEREAAAQAEQRRIAAEAEVARATAEAAAHARVKASALFGNATHESAAAAAESAQAEADAKARAAIEEAQRKAAAEAKALADQQERERLAEEARIQREEEERQKRLEAERKEIEKQRVKGSRVEVVPEIVDIWAVPREFLAEPKPRLADLKAAYKAGRTEIPGVRFREETKITVRAEPVGAMA